jgi:fidgetin-like protein 1
LLKEVKHKLKNLEIKEIASKLKDYSCSDIKAVVKEACMEPLRHIEKKDLIEIDKEKIREIKKEDFDKAISNTPPSLKKKDILYYEEFEKNTKILK